MSYERRDKPERRRGERRTTGRIIKLTDSNFEREILIVPVFGLVQFSKRDSIRCKKQEQIVRQVAQDFWTTQRLRVGLFEVSEENRAIPERYGIKRLPTIILFHRRDVAYRTSRLQSEKALKKSISAAIVTDTKVFVERRHKGDRRKGHRREQTVESVVWRSLISELNTTPWPVILAVKPRDPMLSHKFAVIVEAAAEKLRVPGLRMLHVVGKPTAAVKSHFELTVDPPGVAVFHEGKLIGEVSGMGTKASLAKELRRILM